MRYKENIIVALYVVFVVLTTASSALAEVSVIVNNGVSVSSISVADLQNISLGKKTEWGDGRAIVFVVQESGAAHDAFLSRYVEKSSQQFQTFWKKQLFSGNGKAPDTLSSDAAVLEYVSKTNGAIGYVDSSAVNGGVKVLKVE